MREMHFGDWEAAPFAEVSAKWPKIYKKWIKSPSKVDIPSGESFAAFQSRVKTFSAVLEKNKSRHIAIVAHAGSLSVLTMLLLKKPLSQFWKWIPPNASISTLKRSIKGKPAAFKIERMKDCAHLGN